MKNNPQNSQDWTLPTEIPPAFALPEQFRESLPHEVQQWLASVEKRIDGMTLERLEEEADRIASEDGPEAERLYRLGCRIFYVRMQQIVEIMFPGMGVEVGVDLLWPQTTNELPGAAVSWAVINGEGLNTGCLRLLKDAGFAVGGSWVE
jgi:hypothetical protein